MRKQVNYLKSTLFDSTLAHFKLTIEFRLTRRRATDNSLENLCYIDNRGNLNLNPNVYLVMTYKSDVLEEQKTVYMSYPQIYKLREMFEEVKQKLFDPKAFILNEEVLEVNPNPQYKDPVELLNIGKNQNWIAISLAAISSEDASKKEKGVAIQLSGSNNLASILSLDEFMSIYAIINDINLPQLQMSIGLFAILNDDVTTQQYNGNPYSVPTVAQIPRQQYPQAGYNQQYQQYTQQTGYQPMRQQTYQQPNQQTGNTNPRYNNQQRMGGRTAYNAAPQQVQQPMRTTTQINDSGQLPAREQKSTAPILNMASIEEVPVENASWDDADLTQIFTESDDE